MLTQSWIRTLFARRVTRPIRKKPLRARLVLEALEERWVLSPIVVNNPTDMPVMGQIDLRQAIAQANTNGGDQTITFDRTVFKTPQTINLMSGQLEVTDTTGTEAIVGPEAGVTVNAGGASRVFQVDGGVAASISGLTISGGTTTGDGGGLYNNGGTLTLTNCTVSGNSATTPASSRGGGLFNLYGTATLSNCTVSGNSAGRNGGGLYSLYGTATLSNCTVSGNSAGRNGGGMISRATTLTLTNCTFSGNSCGRIGGGFAAVFGGSATLSNCTVSGNTAGLEGGAGRFAPAQPP